MFDVRLSLFMLSGYLKFHPKSARRYILTPETRHLKPFNIGAYDNSDDKTEIFKQLRA
ncbi:hypothetical protein D1AOALGA4SA_13046 [Olavius algarvensis Delta 1 endosymbiont]|nr:hypothetical protein D1AOALGA4SA_13046 [Olavius algarvensis Delta 1 endosymbiont]